MEYFLVVYEESGDEIHFMLFEMKYYHIFIDIEFIGWKYWFS